MTQVQAVFMDLDGTLLDSAQLQTKCWLRVLKDFGYDVQPSQVRARIGIGAERVLYDLCGLSGASARARQILRQRERLLRGYCVHEIEAFPRVHALLDQLQQSGMKLIVSTAASRHEAFALLGRAQLLTTFDHVICREDVAETKPASDAVRLGLARTGVRPDHAVYLASSPYDLAAAHAAMIHSVALRCGGWPDAALADASAIFADPAALLTQIHHSPFANDHEWALPKPFSWQEPALWTQGAPRSRAA